MYSWLEIKMNAVELFGMDVGESQTVMIFLTGLNFLMILYTIWLRKKIREAGDRIESSHKETMDLANTVLTTTQFHRHKQLKNYIKLSSKNDWYIFGLVNLSVTNKNRNIDNKIEIINSFEIIGALWCKRPEDVACDYALILDGDENEKPSKINQPVLSGGNF